MINKSVAINIAAGTTTHVVPVANVGAGQDVIITGLTLLAGGTVNLTIQDTAGTALTGPLPLTAAAQFNLTQTPISQAGGRYGWAVGGVGKGIDFVTDAGSQVSGVMTYELRPVT